MSNRNDISEELLESVEKFLNNSMETEEKLQFEAKLQEDAVLREQVEDIKILIAGIETASFKNKLDDFHTEFERQTQEKPIKRITQNNRSISNYMYAIAASVVIFLGLYWAFNSQKSHEKIFQNHFTPDPGLPTIMSSNNNYDFYDGMVNYKRKEYDIALEKWMSLLSQKRDNDTLNYFIGVTYLAKGNSQEAILYLEKVSNQKESIFLNDSYYYLGLSNLKNNALTNAKENFLKSKHPNAKKVINAIEEK